MLDPLPDETIGGIVVDLPHVDLNTVSLVSYRLRAIALPFLFRSLKLTYPKGYDGQKILSQLNGLAKNKPILSQVRELIFACPRYPFALVDYASSKKEPMLTAYTVAPHVLSLPFPNLRQVSLIDLPLDNAFLVALINLATRREIELNMKDCQRSDDASPISAFELRIVSLTATPDARHGRVLGTHQSAIYHLIPASSCHVHHLSLGPEIGDIINRLLQTKFNSLRSLELRGSHEETSGTFPSTLSKLLRHLGSLNKLRLSAVMTVDPEILFQGASDPPHYNFLAASYQTCRILLPNNAVTTLHCPAVRYTNDITANQERDILTIVDEGIRRNKKPLYQLEIPISDREADRILMSLARTCSEFLKSLIIHIPGYVSL
jgi:hypothetical protein